MPKYTQCRSPSFQRPSSLNTKPQNPLNQASSLQIQWYLLMTETLGTGFLSFVGWVSLPRRLALSKLAPRPHYVWLASSPGFPSTNNQEVYTNSTTMLIQPYYVPIFTVARWCMYFDITIIICCNIIILRRGARGT